MKMCILSKIFVWTNIVEMKTVELGHFFFCKSCVVHNFSVMTCRIVMKLIGVLDYRIGMCILAGIYVFAEYVEMTAVKPSRFSANLGLMCRLQLLFNNLLDCFET